VKVIVAEHFGICFGVRDAIAAAERAAAERPLTVLGELVHNPVVRERLALRGVIEAPANAAPRSAAAMITAHGTSDARREYWRAAGVELLDGTCPLVRHAHTQLRLLVNRGYLPVVVGKRDHVEVVGLTGDFPDAIVIETEDQIESLPDCRRFGVISQTTQPIGRVLRLVGAIRDARPHADVCFVGTVCKPTKDRQAALRKLLTQTELIVVVGGRSSNNTRELGQEVRAAGKRAIHIERAEELSRSDFVGFAIVGVTAGTSTLRETVEQVVRRLEEF
jgi:4-hydroxy-3-methylbut-2-enyl diphosphate reductase